ncbi:MAG: hypothetical protein GX936_08325 [Clostridiales bacterium]|jgi:flagellin-specific chaperone FliS|nr:hypothetical protein [Clostridiales bacterium]
MLDYERLYRIMFNGITDAVECMEQDDYERAKETLIRAQQAAEEYYMTADEEDGGRSVYILPHDLY